jgi:hypothetical protein
MNYSTAIFLINKDVRAVVATYEDTPTAPRTTFKTFDKTIKVNDFVIVPTDTRHKMTVVKIVDVDVDFDMDAPTPMAWVIGCIELADYQNLLGQEADAVKAIKSAELRQKRENLSKALFADHIDTLRALPIATIASADNPIPQPPPAPGT